MPKQVDHSQRRREFISAAYDTLLRSGLANTTLRTVRPKEPASRPARWCTTSRTRTTSFARCSKRTATSCAIRWRRSTGEKAGRDALHALALEALPTDNRSAMGFRIWLALWYHSEASQAMRNEERRRYKEWVGRITLALEQAIDLGELDRRTDVAEEARLFVALVDGLGIQSLMSKQNQSTQRNSDAVDRYLNRLVRTPDCYISRPPACMRYGRKTRGIGAGDRDRAKAFTPEISSCTASPTSKISSSRYQTSSSATTCNRR